ncbi:PAS domain S-box-containing protein [Ohtaekwangia koreensis]|uniref:histidine kinase n=2 Tax=Ohtaekwangia koreensis TaxID=688867 RepID=A0A1T5M0V8_9BACT|nr:PAS domain S-box-containing protein [Ohtaekwangia koreensis]
MKYSIVQHFYRGTVYPCEMRLEVSNVSLSEQNLSEQSVSFDKLIDFIPALIARVDCNMVVQYANQGFRKWFSRIDDPAGNSFPIIIGEQIFNQIQRYLGKTLVGEPAHLTISFQHDGEYRCMEVDIRPEFDYNQKVSGFIFYASDISSELDVERSLHDYFENATIGLHWVNEDGIIIWANREELTMLGYEPDEYIGQPITRFHKNQQIIQEILCKLRKKEIIKNCEAELLCKDGSSRFVTINSSVLWKDGEFVHTRCFTIDITAQKLAAKAMRENQERFKVMSNLVPVIIWTTDENGLCIFLNSKWSELTGKKNEDGLGQPMAQRYSSGR